jgi:uncharacterized iron-regulated protein
MTRFLIAVTAVAASIAQQAPSTPATPPATSTAPAASAQPAPGYVPERVYDTKRQAFTDFEVMIADLAKADVVFVGEQHDDPNTHRLEAALLEGLRRRSFSPTVSLEMFERDVQSSVDSYLAGKSTEEEFLKSARPWPRYATDYRPLMELAKAATWPVVASNVPRKYASDVAKTGLAALDALPREDRARVAADVQCPKDGYFDRFSDTMKSHPVPGTEKLSADEQRAAIERYYFSQCVKDETMAEAIAAAATASGAGNGSSAGKPVVHFNGSFHSDFVQGTASRVQRRLPGRRVAVVSILPVKDLDGVTPSSEDLKRAEYLVYTVAAVTAISSK